MPIKKHTKTQREEVLAEVARLDRRGCSQYEIARQLGVSQPQVSYDLKVIRKRYAQTQRAERAAKVAEKLEEYREVKREAWEAWERSRLDAERRVEEKAAPLVIAKPKPKEGEEAKPEKPPDLLTVNVKTTTQGQSGDPRYLQAVLDCLAAERELEGLDPETKGKGPGGTNVFVMAADFWERLLSGPAPVEQIEAEVRALPDRNGHG